jgi:hypothetical protein
VILSCSCPSDSVPCTSLNTAAFAAQASALTIGEVADGLCPEAAAALANNTVLGDALQAAKDVEITLPGKGQNPVIVAPSDAAFQAALAKLEMTPEQLLGDSELLYNVLARHFGASSSKAPITVDLTGKECWCCLYGLGCCCRRGRCYPRLNAMIES